MLPFVIVLDLDGTIIGAIDDHIVEWIVNKHIRQNGGGLNNVAFNKTMRLCMMNGLQRPHFSDFVNTLIRNQHGFEIFIYTASTKDWAPIPIGCVENITGIKFQRPIFSRDHCQVSASGATTKSLAAIKPSIFRTLKKKYTDLKSVSDLNNRILMVDNSDVLVDQNAWIPCPTYDYVSNYDVLKSIDLDVLRSNFPSIFSELVRQGLLSRNLQKNIKTYDEFMSLYYSKLAKNFAVNGRRNAVQKTDTFWKVFETIAVPIMVSLLKNNGDLSPMNIAYIKNQLQTSLGPAGLRNAQNLEPKLFCVPPAYRRKQTAMKK